MKRRSVLALVAVGLVAGSCGAPLAAPSGGADSPPTRTAPPSSEPTVTPESSGAAARIFVGTIDDWKEALQDCLRHVGWTVTTHEDGSWSANIEGRFARYQFDHNACVDRIGILPEPAPLTRDQIVHRYVYLLEMRACLAALGYEISEPPPLQTFIDTWPTGPWTPYDDLNVGPGDWAAANLACPQIEGEPRVVPEVGGPTLTPSR